MTGSDTRVSGLLGTILSLELRGLDPKTDNKCSGNCVGASVVAVVVVVTG